MTTNGVVHDETVKVMLDSGGFSAWRLGKSIDLNRYCDFIEANQDWVGLYVALDHIAPDDPETAARIGFDTLKEMRRRGFKPIPVWHCRESLDWIDRMLDLGCDYLGFSTTSARGIAIDNALELAWSKVVTSSGEPTVQVHAFGNSHVPTLFKYPWASADSSSWLRGQKYGRIMLHGIPTGRLNHRHTTKRKTDNVLFDELTDRLIHTSHARDISMLDEHGGEDFAIVRDHIASLNIDVDELLENRRSRRTWLTHSYIAATFFLRLEHQVRSLQPIRFPPIGGFITGHGSSAPPITLPEFDLYMAIGACPSTLPALYVAGSRKPLASYYYTNSDNHAQRMRTYYTDPQTLLERPPFGKYVEMLSGWLQPDHPSGPNRESEPRQTSVS